MPLQTWRIDIDQQPGQAATFNPQTLEVAAGDMIFWRNNTSAMHQPADAAAPHTPWVDKIPGKLAGQPAPTSTEVSFANAGTYSYICALDSQMAGGTIIVT